MKYLHIMHKSNFLPGYIKFIYKNFDFKDHYFLIADRKRDVKIPFVEENNIEIVEDSFINIIKEFTSKIYKAEKVILHSLFDYKIVFLLYFQPWILKKCYWVVWGGDLYYYKFRKKSFKSNIYEWARRKVIRYMGFIISSINGDYKLAKEVYNTRAKWLEGMYPSHIDFSLLDGVSENYNKNKDKKVILVGNSATPTNNHIDALKFLAKYKNENFQIICPLSYGSYEDYKKEVINFGNKIFGDKFKPLLRFMEKEEYAKTILNKVDIAIMNHDRQQAVNTMRVLLYLKRKIYLREEVSPYKQFQSLGAKVYDIKDIKNQNYNSFIQFDNEIGDNNKRVIFNFYEQTTQMWSNILGDV